MNRTLKLLPFLLALPIVLGGSSCPPSWNFTLTRLTVVDAEEETPLVSNGDEPYFIVIGFESRWDTPDSTRVFWNSALEELGHLEDGESVAIPSEMGQLRFNPGDSLPTVNQIRNGEKPKLLGSMVIAMESDSTPFSDIRARINDRLVPALRNELIRVVEDGRINVATVEDDLNAAFGRVAAALEQSWVDDFVTWLTSLGDPDDRVGLHVFLFPAVDPSVIDLLPSNPDPDMLTILKMQTQSIVHQFRGNDATYRVDIRGAYSPGRRSKEQLILFEISRYYP